MGLIYVNPEGPDGNPDPIAAAHDIRDTFGRMAMDDEETVALIAGGHSFGKTHGAAPASHVGKEPEACELEAQGFGWRNSFGTGKGGDTITSGLEVTWTTTPTKWSNNFFENLFGFEWELTKSPAGAQQWVAKGGAGAGTIPHAHDKAQAPAADHAHHRPVAALRPGLREDLAPLPRPSRPVRRRLRPRLVQAHAPRHGPARPLPRPRGAGRRADLAGPDTRRSTTRWSTRRTSSRSSRRCSLRASRSPQLVSTAWASASTFRGSDKRGGANGARIRLAPQKDWAVNQPEQLAQVLKTLERHPRRIQPRRIGRQEDLARRPDRAGRRRRAWRRRPGRPAATVTVPFTPGRMDASQEQTDVESFEPLEPLADGFRNFLKGRYSVPAEALLIDKAQLLTLTAPEMTVLVGGLRVLGANVGGAKHGVFTAAPRHAEQRLLRQPARHGDRVEAGARAMPACSRAATARAAQLRWTGTRVDLVFGSNAQLRAVAEVYAQRRRAGEVRRRFRRRVDEGDELGPVRLPLAPDRARRYPIRDGSDVVVNHPR